MQKKISPNLWQSDRWKNFQTTAKNFSFWITQGDAKALIIKKSPHFLKFWKPSLWEIPRGPIGNLEDIAQLLTKIFEEAKKNKIPTVRIYPPFGATDFWKHFPKILETFDYQDAPEIFPEHTLMLNLTQTEDQIFAQMKQGGRRNIRKAIKNNIEIFEENNIENFWSIMQQTSKRDGFTHNKKHVYQAMLKSFGKNCRVLSARDQTGEVLASKIFVVSKKMGVYYYGASSNNKRNLMAPYLLQWEGIKWTKKKGALQYDFLGICPEGDKNHQLSSVAQFKHKFGGERVICDTGIDFYI